SAGSGTLQGTLTATAVNGLATFTNLGHNVATNITISFTSGSLTNTTSTAIAVSPAAASQLAFATQPANGTVGSMLVTQPVLRSRDQFGNNSTVGLAGSQPATVTLNAGTGPLLGTTTLVIGTTAGNGIVSFSDLRVDWGGTNDKLTASITANIKVYDGTTPATIATPSVSGVIGSDTVNLSGGTATFSDKNVANGKTVTATGLNLSGTAAGNYQLASTSATTTADITAKGLTVSGVTAHNKVYDGTTVATLDLSSVTLVGVVSGDGVTLDTNNVAGAFADADAASNKLVTLSGLTLSGADTNKDK